MKITEIKIYFVAPPETKTGWIIQKHWLFIRIKTDDGITGWGEAFTLKDRERSLGQLISEISRYVLGHNPFHINYLLHGLYDKFAERRAGVEFYCAVSGIEQALWDIVGKSLNTPVYDLLGGPCRDRIRIYANGWSRGVKSPEEMGQRALEVVEMGFSAIKFYPFLNQENEDQALEHVRAVREAVGSDVDILIDVWRLPDPGQAIRVAKRLEEFRVFWYEEPVPSENIDVLAEVRRHVNLPVVTGECLYTKFDFRQVLEKQAADILNPDVASCGGILALRDIAAMAEPYYITVSPHNFNSTTIALAATVQVSAIISNFLITEYFVNFAEAGKDISQTSLKIENGFIRIPSTPGLGLELDESSLQRYTFQEFPLRKW